MLSAWHVEPTTQRTFDIELAKQKLDAAGYTLDASGQAARQGGQADQPAAAHFPNTDDNYPKAAQFIKEWYGQLGIRCRPRILDSRSLGEMILPPEAGDGYTANYDIELWGWSGAIDPNGLLQIFECNAIGSSSDSQYCNPAYDQLYEDQLAAPHGRGAQGDPDPDAEPDLRQGRYDILYYDANLEAYRTDRFAGWQNQPTRTATPLFTYGTLAVHAADRRQGGAQPVDRVRGGGGPGSPGASGAASAGGHPGASASGERRLGRLDHTDRHRVVIVVIAIVAGGYPRRTRRKTAGAKTGR